MKNGDFTVVDATHCRKVGFSRYRSLCQRYRYRAFVVDFSAVPLEVCLANNMKRPLYKRVPEEGKHPSLSRPVLTLPSTLLFIY
jgi:predicted kinase